MSRWVTDLVAVTCSLSGSRYSCGVGGVCVRDQRGIADRRAHYFGSITGLALIVGPVLGGAIAQGIARQWIFWLDVPVGLILISLALRRILESFGPGTGIDIPGVLLVSGAALGLTWALTRGNSAGWSSPEVVVALLGGVLLAGGSQGAYTRSMIDPQLLYALLAGKLRWWLAGRARVRHGITGMLLVGTGLGIALTRRR